MILVHYRIKTCSSTYLVFQLPVVDIQILQIIQVVKVRLVLLVPLLLLLLDPLVAVLVHQKAMTSEVKAPQPLRGTAGLVLFKGLPIQPKTKQDFVLF